MQLSASVLALFFTSFMCASDIQKISIVSTNAQPLSQELFEHLVEIGSLYHETSKSSLEEIIPLLELNTCVCGVCLCAVGDPSGFVLPAGKIVSGCCVAGCSVAIMVECLQCHQELHTRQADKRLRSIMGKVKAEFTAEQIGEFLSQIPSSQHGRFHKALRSAYRLENMTHIKMK